jgi:hypothetical protein
MRSCRTPMPASKETPMPVDEVQEAAAVLCAQGMQPSGSPVHQCRQQPSPPAQDA